MLPAGELAVRVMRVHCGAPDYRSGVTEQVLEPAPLLLDSDQRQGQVRDRVADGVVDRFVLHGDQDTQSPSVRALKPVPGKRRGQPVRAFFDFDGQDGGPRGEGR